MSISNAAATVASWDASKHPRAKAGSGSGGQFAPLSYDSKSKTGAGYSKAGGDNRVRAAQEALRKAGFTDGKGAALRIDGKLGPKTTASLIKYQRAHGLKADGRITPALLAALKKGGPAPAKKRTTAQTRARAAKRPTGRAASKTSGRKAGK